VSNRVINILCSTTEGRAGELTSAGWAARSRWLHCAACAPLLTGMADEVLLDR
jgi:hypothetical protein